MNLEIGDRVRLIGKTKQATEVLEKIGDVFLVSNITSNIYSTAVKGRAPYVGLVGSKNRSIIWMGTIDNPDFKVKRVQHESNPAKRSKVSKQVQR